MEDDSIVGHLTNLSRLNSYGIRGAAGSSILDALKHIGPVRCIHLDCPSFTWLAGLEAEDFVIPAEELSLNNINFRDDQVEKFFNGWVRNAQEASLRLSLTCGQWVFGASHWDSIVEILGPYLREISVDHWNPPFRGLYNLQTFTISSTPLTLKDLNQLPLSLAELHVLSIPFAWGDAPPTTFQSLRSWLTDHSNNPRLKVLSVSYADTVIIGDDDPMGSLQQQLEHAKECDRICCERTITTSPSSFAVLAQAVFVQSAETLSDVMEDRLLAPILL